MQRSHLFGLLVLLCIFSVAAGITYYFYVTPNDAKNSDASKTLTFNDASFTDMEDNPLSFDAYEGKVRVVNSWASWSPYSVQELQDLDVLAKEYMDQNVVVIGINRMETKETAERFLRSIPSLQYLHIVLDSGDVFFSSLEGYAMPETVIYDQNGNIYFHKRGPMSLEEMRKKTQEALETDA